MFLYAKVVLSGIELIDDVAEIYEDLSILPEDLDDAYDARDHNLEDQLTCFAPGIPECLYESTNCDHRRLATRPEEYWPGWAARRRR